jgi:lipopolysaccharide transport system permease protein
MATATATVTDIAMDIHMATTNNMDKPEKWDIYITPNKSLFALDLGAIWRYRDLLSLLVRRDFVSQFKQTILGPAWFFIQPIFTTIIFTVVFGRLANIPTDGIPQPLFYMAGIIIWNYFSECLMKTSETFRTNQGLFGKVYFPRLIVPLSVVTSNLLKLGVQLLLFIALYIYYIFQGFELPGLLSLIFPLIILFVALLGLSLGLIVSSLTTKYRDLKFLIQFGVQLAMYASPIVYPLSLIEDDKKWMILMNPISSFIEMFRFALFGQGHVTAVALGYSVISTLVLLVLSIVIFNRVEKSFIDTV